MAISIGTLAYLHICILLIISEPIYFNSIALQPDITIILLSNPFIC